MTIADALRESGLESLEAEILAAHACGRDRTWIVAHAADLCNEESLMTFRQLCDRRKRGEPVAYIVGRKDFYGRSFHVTRATLIPRPATEELVRSALDLLSGKTTDAVRDIDTQIVAWSSASPDVRNVRLAVDVGTGSGCIAVTMACERPDLRLIATDISGEALITARQNAIAHGVADRITFKQGEGLKAAGTMTEPFLLVSNPPYIPQNISLDQEVADFEPSSALFAGENGTDVLHPLIKEAMHHPLCRGFVVECREEQILKILPPNATWSAA